MWGLWAYRIFQTGLMFHRPTRSAGWFRGPIISGRHRVAEVSKRTLHCRVQDGIWPAFDDMQLSDSSGIQTRHSRRSSSLHARGYSSRQKAWYHYETEECHAAHKIEILGKPANCCSVRSHSRIWLTAFCRPTVLLSLADFTMSECTAQEWSNNKLWCEAQHTPPPAAT